MGIPSYYKKLLSTVPSLLTKNHPEGDIQWLFMDFNCLIYHCLHREDTPAYPGDAEKDVWEAQLLDCIVTYCLKVVKQVSPKQGVFIAVDGVVPMAKMRQQRLRRFKSIWLSKTDLDSDSGEGEKKEKWDTNAITPGTEFMKKLRIKLEAMIAKYGKKTWHLSSSDEPGEGEHKIINQWRTGKYTGNFAIYGLDADLIVLSILGRETCSIDNKIWLFREEVEAGKISYDSCGEEVFEWFSVNALRDWLCSEQAGEDEKRRFILNYCFAMSVLGNDFLPSALSLKIRDDGHSELLDILKNLSSKNINIINSSTLGLDTDAITSLFTVLATNEKDRICKYISKKAMMSRNLCGEGQGEGQGMKIGENNWPLLHVEETVLLQDRKLLASNWQELYMTKFISGFSYTSNNITHMTKEYLYGIQWIWAYYTGRWDEVCFNWFYPFAIPPLWEWIRDYLNQPRVLPEFPHNVKVRAIDIRTVEQLALVLPLESWALIPTCPEKLLPKYAPQFYPQEFTFDSVGKRFFWECESQIPLPSILELKEIVRNYITRTS